MTNEANIMLEKLAKSRIILITSNLILIYLLWSGVSHLLEHYDTMSKDKVLAGIIGAVFLGFLLLVQVFAFFIKRNAKK